MCFLDSTLGQHSDSKWLIFIKKPSPKVYFRTLLLIDKTAFLLRTRSSFEPQPPKSIFSLNNFWKLSTLCKRIFKSSNQSRFWKISCRGHSSIPVGNFKKSLNFKYFFCVSYNFAFMTDIQTRLFQKISKISQDLVIFTFSFFKLNPLFLWNQIDGVAISINLMYHMSTLTHGNRPFFKVHPNSMRPPG